MTPSVLARVYVIGVVLFTLVLPRIPNNFQILLLAVVACAGWPYLRDGLRGIGPRAWWVIGPLAALCGWIAVQTPLAASEPVALFGPKEATGVAVSLWMLFVIPGLVYRGHGLAPLDEAMKLVAALVFVGVLVSYWTGAGERHKVAYDVYRAYFYFSDGIDVPMAFVFLWHVVHRNWIWALLGAASLLIMLGKLPLGLLALFAIVALAVGNTHLRLTTLGLAGMLVLAALLVVPMGRAVAWMEAPAPEASQPPETSPLLDEGRYQLVDEQTAACVKRAMAAESFLLRAECAASSAKVYPGPLVVNAGINTLARRTVGAIAALHIVREHPILGTGYHQSWRLMDDMATIDPFGINARFERPWQLWHRIGQIRNVWLRAAAEFGLPGVTFLILFAGGLVSIAVVVVRATRGVNGMQADLGAAAAIWTAVHLVCAQTTPWLLPGSISLVWVGIWAGVMTAGLVAAEFSPAPQTTLDAREHGRRDAAARHDHGARTAQ